MYTAHFTPAWGGSLVPTLTLSALSISPPEPPPAPTAPLAQHDTTPRRGKKSIAEEGTSIKGFVGGTVSGLTKLLVGHPFDTIKVRMQCSPYGTYTGPLDCFLQLARRESLLGLYKGATPPALGWAITDSVLLGSLHNYRRLLARLTNPDFTDDAAKLHVKYHALAGLFAGWTNSFVTTPVELVKAKLQMQTQRVSLPLSHQKSAARVGYTGPVDCVKQIVAHRGVLGMWHALPATLLFRSSFAAMFGSYAYFQRTLTEYGLAPATVTFVSGGLAAEVFWLTAFPADVVKNRMMADNITQPQYTSIRSAWVSVWNARGAQLPWYLKVRGVYTGFLPCLLRAFPTNAAALFAFETAMHLMGAEKV